MLRSALAAPDLIATNATVASPLAADELDTTVIDCRAGKRPTGTRTVFSSTALSVEAEQTERVRRHYHGEEGIKNEVQTQINAGTRDKNIV